jgi:hypothetical protein
MAERDASITFIKMQLEKALEDETIASIALAQARAALTDTVRVFRGLAVRVRPVLEALGLEPPWIISESEGNITLWFTDVIG